MGNIFPQPVLLHRLWDHIRLLFAGIAEHITDILRCEFILHIAELAFHRERSSLFHDLGQLFFAQTQQGRCDSLTAAVALIGHGGGAPDQEDEQQEEDEDDFHFGF